MVLQRRLGRHHRTKRCQKVVSLLLRALVLLLLPLLPTGLSVMLAVDALGRTCSCSCSELTCMISSMIPKQ